MAHERGEHDRGGVGNSPVDHSHTNFVTLGAAGFPGLVGVEVKQVTHGKAVAVLRISHQHFAPNGYVHAGSLITLADTIAGYGCLYNLPPGATSFTTLELTANFLAAAKSGIIKAEALLKHGGRTTQVWDVTITSEDNGRTLALFRCTQLILYSENQPLRSATSQVAHPT